MKWRKFGEEKPHHEEKILFIKKGLHAKIHVKMIISRNPYISDKKYNPDYWCFLDELRNEVAIDDEDQWCRIELPKKDT